MTASSSSPAFRVVIAGGGVAGIEAALALRAIARERVALTVAADADVFHYRPFAVVRPFRSRGTYRIELARVADDLDAQLVAADAVAVDGVRQVVVLSDGRELSYDALLIAIGARAEATVGGGALTPWDWGGGHAFRLQFVDPLARGEAKSAAFVVPAGLTWPLPLYELALLTHAHLRDEGVADVALSIVTPEKTPLGMFGREASAAVAALLEQRGIALHTETEATSIENGSVRTSDGAEIPADVTAALPVIRPRTLEGVRTDGDGFIPVDDYGRVAGMEQVFAAGDCTNEPIKQGGLAAQQADVAATAIAALAGVPVTVEPYSPRLHAVLLTGDTPLHLETSGARPVDAPWIHPQPAEKIVARHLSSYLAQATPPLPLETVP